ncbi:3-methyl-2-oxobutanoate hydroxymethyltransferase [Hahella aquimaris]|uniref:3-methyl-2-oxobutanoate hydroxymethyltransferase n=1 Tax=Hahella sp. HNIBRBA332 TaxID=3015983 RepID=UPI00273C9ACC|nr:3-methyl-2-oxobutanoate hydroxymethyltransferase [Hahella sp. HNIBRBA332]WLQ13750.1 3-methyl-2-oxobutanoate hydroxymethyltransferase [Hahella sp. HNIBRBA332]
MSITLSTLLDLKKKSEKFAVMTAYDATFAYEMDQAGVEVILVGDSLGMVLQGHDSTVPVRLEDMVYHTASVKRGARNAFIIADMPFMSYGTPEQAMAGAKQLMQAGAHMVKLEGGAWLCDAIAHLSRQGVPVCAHLGLTPQSVNKFGGYKVQGKEASQAQLMLEDAKALEQAGADILLLECVPTKLAKQLTEEVCAPVVGIGAGPYTDGQVLVMHDLLGVGAGKKPKFVKNFLAGSDSIQVAFKGYVEAVKSGAFPAEEHSFNI